MPARCGKSYVKTSKSDHIDAEATAKTAVVRPEPVASANGVSNFPQTKVLTRIGGLTLREARF